MSPQNKIYVAVIGVGLVGSELVDQLLAIPAAKNPFILISLSSSTKTIFDTANPIQAGGNWKDRLATSLLKPDYVKLTENLAKLVAASHKVAVVDNTSSDAIAALYPGWLERGVNVVTPNKKAYSGDAALYESILSTSQKSGARYLNESTVGAGLPIVSTLKELVITGDKVTKIEGVLSGTMSYIFNNFSTASPTGPSFSSVVEIARKKGYTEPHPADDLNGFDVARKLTILTRTVISHSHTHPGLPTLRSFKSVNTQSLIPSALEGIPTGDEFVSRLPEFDGHFAKLREEASKEGKVLRFVGVMNVAGGIVKASLEKYSVDHPFATSLGGSDNIVMFHTERYGARPLIVQGAGAGAAVTAMGVLGDLFKLV